MRGAQRFGAGRCWLLFLASVPLAAPAVVKSVFGSNSSELTHCSSGGGCHIYLTGTNLGSAFAPPTVLLGERYQVGCDVQPFTSAKNKVHCIVRANGAPAATPAYDAKGKFVTLPISVFAHGKVRARPLGTLARPSALSPALVACSLTRA